MDFFARVMSQAAMLAWPFGEYRDNEKIMLSMIFELRRALSEVFHELSANYACALNEDEPKAKSEFSAAGNVE